MKLKRKKIGDRQYLLIDTATGKDVAIAAQTGEHGRDNYPWDWYLVGKLDFEDPAGRPTGVADALKVCIETIESRAKQYGLKP